MSRSTSATPSSPERPGLMIATADGAMHVPSHLTRHLGLCDSEKLYIPVSTESLRFALSTLSPYPSVLPQLDDSFLDDLLTLADRGFITPLEWVSCKLEERDPIRAFTLEMVVKSTQARSRDTSPSEPVTPSLEPNLASTLDTYFSTYDGDSSDIDSWSRATLLKYVPAALPQLERYLASLGDCPQLKLTLGWDGDDREGFGFGYGYGERDGYGYRGRSGYGSGNGPYGSGLDDGGIHVRLERLDGAGYEGRYHSARW